MGSKGITLITTVKNEEHNVDLFMNSVLAQKVLPDEIVVVDAMSTDGTMGKLQGFHAAFKKAGVRYVVIKKQGNRSVGRNEAIRYASYDFVVCSDVGCQLDSAWIEHLGKYLLSPDIMVVAGYYKPYSPSGNDAVFQRCLAAYTSTMLDKLDPATYLPSSRSIAFRKSMWEKVGGYPEELDTAEDLVFAKKMHDKLQNVSKQWVFEQSAIVYWPQKRTLLQAFQQLYDYAKGDGKALYIRPATPLLFARYILLLAIIYYYVQTQQVSVLYLLILAALAYIVWAIAKNYHYVRHILALLYLPLLQITADIAVMCGMIVGVYNRYT